ncbi:hypothetical protein L6452_19082 [Arctium lappa]|uniref:Uncharacterized protein n=1 Tax=Arctium lappa TaxID=4217 RepID=A0ACB9B7P3_ARCLA|nr:hypothetical protein L6452_19082 [Arctium lappa]
MIQLILNFHSRQRQAHIIRPCLQRGTYRRRRRYKEEELVWKKKPVEDEKKDELKGKKSCVHTHKAKKNNAPKVIISGMVLIQLLPFEYKEEELVWKKKPVEDEKKDELKGKKSCVHTHKAKKNNEPKGTYCQGGICKDLDEYSVRIGNESEAHYDRSVVRIVHDISWEKVLMISMLYSSKRGRWGRMLEHRFVGFKIIKIKDESSRGQSWKVNSQ